MPRCIDVVIENGIPNEQQAWLAVAAVVVFKKSVLVFDHNARHDMIALMLEFTRAGEFQIHTGLLSTISDDSKSGRIPEMGNSAVSPAALLTPRPFITSCAEVRIEAYTARRYAGT